jgi:probable F420-dependent oxidoreductase
MKFGISYNTAAYGTDPRDLTRVARHAEACGFESILFPEHIVLHPHATLGGYELPPTMAVADPLECLAFLAGATDTILLGTAALLLPYRHPVVLAKQLATIDILSGGRLKLVTVGLGTLEREAASIGVDFRTRGRRADEAIDVMRKLWAGGSEGVTHHGEFFSLDEVCVYPKPVNGDIPLHVGGSSGAAARRAGYRGDGYFPGGRLSTAERENQLEMMRHAAIAMGRDPNALQYSRWGSVDLDPAGVERYAQQGVNRIVVSLPIGLVENQLAELTRFSNLNITY